MKRDSLKRVMLVMKIKTKLYCSFLAIEQAWEQAATECFGNGTFNQEFKLCMVTSSTQDVKEQCSPTRSLRLSVCSKSHNSENGVVMHVCFQYSAVIKREIRA